MKLKLLALILCLIPSFLLAKQQSLVGCFSSGNINVKYVEISHDNALLGYVAYGRSLKFIPLAFMKKSEMTFDDRPSEFTVTWSEVIDGKINGLYVVATQGARFNTFYYKSQSGGKTIFEENIGAYTNDGNDCKW
ncbi:hypothetical protein I4446_25410 [Klebsiella pneumoniae]|uniref:hypothetical protein n=2 Tax=Klebsiella pneumoniae TaxID=573 RepID=UPI0012BAAC07|nr:hypothetical protein [Klebsiella pneumoniae]HDS4700318.1 hypothetical protein [Klebsiella pneumoniae subsp. pneumoniae]MBD7686795.1 hypothetical protein [Klebsiella pneumoniae]MBG1936844.1 hypothetical protein [Klebsiella pneumoniae]MTF46206.1 hypothetical protein [Klebsiella pneumoniae]HBR7626522.1 hypothetical protein [Klebsiella pneumoniae]